MALFKKNKIEKVSLHECNTKLDPEYAQRCIDVVENIRKKYHADHTIYPDEIRAIYKLHGLEL